jgi:hypothetical protein
MGLGSLASSACSFAGSLVFDTRRRLRAFLLLSSVCCVAVLAVPC